MSSPSLTSVPLLQHLPASLPLDGALRLELQDGVPVLRASATVQHRITTLLQKHQDGTLSPEETTELDRYEELDAYLSFLNRMVRNMLASPQR
jgi:hypothetical protein